MKTLQEYINESINVFEGLTPGNATNMIADVYLKHLDELSWMQKQHFLNRLKLCDGYEGCMLEEQEKEIVNKLISSISNIYKYVTASYDINTGYNKLVLNEYEVEYDNRKKLVHNTLEKVNYDSWKKLLLFSLLSERISILIRMGYADKLKEKSVNGSSLYSQLYELYPQFTSKINEMLKKDPFGLLQNNGALVNIINLLYYTKFVLEKFGLDNSAMINAISYVQNTIIEECGKLFFSSIHGPNHLECEQNVIYGLTHIVIGESEFYTKHISRANCQLVASWIRSYVEMAKNSYREFTTPDLLCESALCLKLLDENFYSKEIEFVKNRLLRQLKKSGADTLYNFKENKNILAKNEHTNILYVLLNKLKVQ